MGTIAPLFHNRGTRLEIKNWLNKIWSTCNVESFSSNSTGIPLMPGAFPFWLWLTHGKYHLQKLNYLALVQWVLQCAWTAIIRCWRRTIQWVAKKVTSLKNNIRTSLSETSLKRTCMCIMFWCSIPIPILQKMSKRFQDQPSHCISVRFCCIIYQYCISACWTCLSKLLLALTNWLCRWFVTRTVECSHSFPAFSIILQGFHSIRVYYIYHVCSLCHL